MDRSPERALDRLRSMPAADTFGFDFLERSPEVARVAMPAAHAMIQVERVLHGGAIAALADTAAVYLLLPQLGNGQSMTSIEFKMNFLRPVLGDRGTVEAVATTVKLGRTVGVASVDVRQAGALCAIGVFTYLIMDVGGGSEGT